MSASKVILGDDNTGINGTQLPNQRVSRNVKLTKKWQQDSINYFIDNKNSDSDVRKSSSEIRDNWDFYNSILSPEEMKRTLDPLGVEEGLMKDDTFNFGFYDVINGPLMTLFGEELKRQFDVKAYALNPNVVNQKDREFKQLVLTYMVQLAKEESVDEETFRTKLQEFDDFRRNDLQSAHEKMANQILEVLSKTPRIDSKKKFNDAFKAKEIVGEEILRVYHVGKEPNFKVVSSENFFVMGLGMSNWVEDGYAWIEEEYLSANKLIEEFAEDLTNSEVTKLLNISSGEETPIHPTQIKLIDTELVKDGNPRESTVLPVPYALENKILVEDGTSAITDSNGNIRIYRIQWLSLRKLGKLKYYDESGTPQNTWVDENYPPREDLGEEVKWIWVNELWEGVKIGEELYKKLRPCPIQMRSTINPSIVKPSYVGYINSIDGKRASCRLDRLKAYQNLFNVWMNKLVTLWAQNIGKAAVIDLAEIPSDMDHEEWYLWLKRFKLAFKNSFEEGKEGRARGLLAGNMQQGNKTIDLSLASEINTAIQMLSWIEARIDKISAVPEPRQGNLTGREGLGVSQQAIISSSNQTEESFFIHDLIKSKTFTVLLEYTKYLWQDEKGIRQYVLDDLSNKLVDVDGALLNEGEYGIRITNSSQLYQMMNTMRSLTHAAMQNGTVNLSDVARVDMATSPSEMLHMLDKAEEKKFQQQQQAQKSAQDAKMQEIQLQEQADERAHQRNLEEIKLENEYKLQIEGMKIGAKSDEHATDNNQNNVEDEVELEAERIKSDSDKEVTMLKINSQKELQSNELQSKEKIAKMNNKNKDQNN